REDALCAKGRVGEEREGGVVGLLPQAEQSFPRFLVPCAAVLLKKKTATAQTGPGRALGSRPPADTARVPECRRAPPQAPPALAPSAVLRRGQYTGPRPVGYAQAPLAGS